MDFVWRLGKWSLLAVFGVWVLGKIRLPEPALAVAAGFACWGFLLLHRDAEPAKRGEGMAFIVFGFGVLAAQSLFSAAGLGSWLMLMLIGGYAVGDNLSLLTCTNRLRHPVITSIAAIAATSLGPLVLLHLNARPRDKVSIAGALAAILFLAALLLERRRHHGPNKARTRQANGHLKLR